MWPCGHRSISYDIPNYEIFFAKAQNTESQPHLHGNRTSISSWTHAKPTPGLHQTRVHLCDPDNVKELSRLHDNFVIVPADKASNNYTFVCKIYYIDIKIEELELHLLPGNPTYNLQFSASEVMDNNKLVLTSFGIQTNHEGLDLPYIFLDSKDAQKSV